MAGQRHSPKRIKKGEDGHQNDAPIISLKWWLVKPFSQYGYLHGKVEGGKKLQVKLVKHIWPKEIK